ncbi:hypothetical protein B0I37DRAFT_442542 [Chaetomium sp. MPI-CAGE-AT-0009]|nr:hypothetical protein B0I37DRAFT_442542 [Chaetomium sp. MPI-CAGE-AT-0009]
MASTSNDKAQQGPSPITGHHPESSGSVYNKSERRNSSIPFPPTEPANPPQPPPSNAPPPSMPKPVPTNPPTPGNRPVQHRFLTPTEWARVAHGIGAIREGEEHQVVHPTCWYWPPKGMPEGLYRDVVGQRAKYGAGFQLLSALHWALLVLQVMFVQVEDFIREVLDTGIVEAQQKVEDILTECFTRFANARATVISNKPEVYSSSSPPAGKPNATPPPGPSAPTRSP